jgi:hypothetical protein
MTASPSRSSWDVPVSRPRAHEQRQTVVDLEALQASRVARLGGAIEALARDLAQTRRELNRLLKENADLRRARDIGARAGAESGRGMLRNREADILAMVRQQQTAGRRKPRSISGPRGPER